jgi:hypothetical protein
MLPGSQRSVYFEARIIACPARRNGRPWNHLSITLLDQTQMEVYYRENGGRHHELHYARAIT